MKMKHGWIIWYAICLHLWWGITMLTMTLGGRDIQGGISWNVYVEVGGIEFWAILMLVGAVMAMISLIKCKRGMVGILLLIPQQVVLAMGAIGVFVNLFGLYGDFELSRVIRVMPLSIGTFVFYTVAILDFHGESLWRRILSR